MTPAYFVSGIEDENGFKVTSETGTFAGWVYPMDYIEGREGTWGAISVAGHDVSTASNAASALPLQLYRRYA